MSADEPGQPDLDNTSDEVHNSSDAANASARKGQPWSEEEHMAFLAGLTSLGKGNWRSISKQYVPTRTPTQVASHAQKHFMRVAGATKRKSRFTALEVEVIAPSKVPRASHNAGYVAQESQQVEQQAVAMAPSQAFQQQMAAFPPMAFPFMHPMMFGFPGPFFPPFMCPPPAFAAAMQNALSKQGPMSPMMMPPMFPMAAMAAMTPFFMAQQMAAAAQHAAAAAHATAAQAATSGGATTAGTGPAATADTANSDEVLPRTHSAPGSPGVCKPEAQHVRPPSNSGTATCATGMAAVPAAGSAAEAVDGPSAAGEVVSAKKRRISGGGEECALVLPQQQLSSLAADVSVAFHASSHSAFRPPQVPQEIKAES